MSKLKASASEIMSEADAMKRYRRGEIEATIREAHWKRMRDAVTETVKAVSGSALPADAVVRSESTEKRLEQIEATNTLSGKDLSIVII